MVSLYRMEDQLWNSCQSIIERISPSVAPASAVLHCVLRRVYGAFNFKLNFEQNNWLHFYRIREGLRGTKKNSTFLDVPAGSTSYHTSRHHWNLTWWIQSSAPHFIGGSARRLAKTFQLHFTLYSIITLFCWRGLAKNLWLIQWYYP